MTLSTVRTSLTALAVILTLSTAAVAAGLPHGWVDTQVSKLSVRNSGSSGKSGHSHPDAAPSAAAMKGWDVLLGGTFSDYKNPLGALMRNGHLDTPGVDKCKTRGGVAVLASGAVVVCRMNGNNASAIEAACGHGGKVVDFVGGGALLVEGHKAVSSSDLLKRQLFDSGAGGLHSQQMHRSDQSVVAMKGGKAHLIFALNATGEEIQSHLVAAGFEAAVKFDGSSGFLGRTSAGAVGAQGKNPTYFLGKK